MHELVIATANPGKFEEIRTYLSPFDSLLRCLVLSDFKNIPEIREDGSTFLENAQKKATIVSTFT